MSHLTPEKCFQAFEEHRQTIAAKPTHSAKFKGNKYFQGRTGGKHFVDTFQGQLDFESHHGISNIHCKFVSGGSVVLL